MTPSFAAFSDELCKIALVQQAVQGMKDALHLGWHGYGDEGMSTRQTFRGQGLAHPAERATMGRVGKAWDTATSLGGATKYLPVGAKSMMVAGTALQARDAMKQEDPTGQGRSRTERTTGLAGNVIGGLAGTGLALKAIGKKSPLLANLAGGIGGGMLGERLMTTPFRHARNAERLRQARLQQQQAQQPQQVPARVSEMMDSASVVG